MCCLSLCSCRELVGRQVQDVGHQRYCGGLSELAEGPGGKTMVATDAGKN